MSRLDKFEKMKQQCFEESTGGLVKPNQTVGCVEPMELFLENRNANYCPPRTTHRCKYCGWKFENATSTLIRELSGAVDAGLS